MQRLIRIGKGNENRIKGIPSEILQTAKGETFKQLIH